MNTLVDKKIHLELTLWKDSEYLLAAFQMKAVLEDWSSTEIALVSNQIKDLSKEEQYTTLANHYVADVYNGVVITQSDVRFMLDHLHHYTHYLKDKAIDEWDEYDWSNYKSLKQKATGCIKIAFALFCDSVNPEHKYAVDIQPSHYYDSYEKALELLSEKQMKNTHIYSLWISQ